MYSIDKPWIPMREATICCWESDKIRGDYSNPHTSLLPNVFSYSERQMKQYMLMIKQFGFTGVQLIDSCYSWNRSGSPEAFHAKLIRMMTAAKEVGLNVSLWVWASFFSGHGWTDENAVYVPSEGNTAFNDPKVRATFEKYYDLYAEMAPYCDILIGHFFDPGLLKDYNDIFAYMKLLSDKFRNINPGIKLAVDMWGSPEDFPEALAELDLGDYLLLEQPLPWPKDKRQNVRRKIKENGYKAGLWGWYIAEYETDQMAGMYVNSHVLKERYLEIKNDCDEILEMTYWSEMEACHIYNLFSLFCSAQLLINPYQDPDNLLREGVEMIWKFKDAEAMYYALKTIEDIRSGDNWNTFWWTASDFRWGTGDNEEDLERIEKSIKGVALLAKKKSTRSEKLALPFEPWVIAKLILPQLEQMRLLAEFKKNMVKLEDALKNNKSADYLYRELDEILVSIPDFNTWVGNFMQVERREQYKIARDFCKRAGIPIPIKSFLMSEQKRWAIEKAAVFQKGMETPFLFDSQFISEGYLAYPKEEAIIVIQSLYDDKLIEYTGDGLYKLSNWKDYRFGFDVIPGCD